MSPGFFKKKKKKQKKKKQKNHNLNNIPDNSVLLKKKTIIENGEKKIMGVTEEGKVMVKYEEMTKKSEIAKLKTIVIEQEEGFDISLSDLEDNKDLIVPLKIKEKIEKIILKILYDEKSVQSLKLLTEKVLERASSEKITISEKPINLIIYQLNKDQKIQFTQKEGWKIRI